MFLVKFDIKGKRDGHLKSIENSKKKNENVPALLPNVLER